MPRSSPEPLDGQAATLLAAAEAAARWFRRPAPSDVAAARTARLRAQGWRDAAVAAHARLRGPAKGDKADASFALREAVEHAAQAVAEAERFGVEPEPGLRDAAEALAKGCAAFAKAASAKAAAERAEALIDAKRWALETERLRREVRSDAHEEPAVASSLRRESVAKRLSSAAESLQQACDALAGTLAE